MPPSLFSYVTKSRHGIYYFQKRIPEQYRYRFNNLTFFRKSLHTRDRREALSKVLNWLVYMNDKINGTDFSYEQQIDEEARLYIRGKKLQREYEGLDPLDVEQRDEFFLHLTDYDKRALEHYGEQVRTDRKDNARQEDSNQRAAQTSHNDSYESRLIDLLEKFIEQQSLDGKMRRPKRLIVTT